MGAGIQRLPQRFIHDIYLGLHQVLATKWLTLAISLPSQESVLKLHIRNKTPPSIKWVSHSWINKVCYFCLLFLFYAYFSQFPLTKYFHIFTSFAYKSTFFQQQWIHYLWLYLYIIVFLSCGTWKIELTPGLSPDNSLFLHIFNHFPSYSALFRKHSLQKKVIWCTVSQQQNHASRDGLKLNLYSCLWNCFRGFRYRACWQWTLFRGLPHVHKRFFSTASHTVPLNLRSYDFLFKMWGL